jgi:hypothetical protein
MKSSFELAMERLNQTAPAVKLTATQKREIAELESRSMAKIAEREIALNAEISKVAHDPEQVAALREQLSRDRRKIQSDLEAQKERVRQAGA